MFSYFVAFNVYNEKTLITTGNTIIYYPNRVRVVGDIRDMEKYIKQTLNYTSETIILINLTLLI
jgi:hypothetical protein